MSRFTRTLLLIVMLAFAIRVAYVAIEKRGPCVIHLANGVTASSPSKCATGDELFYNSEANFVANGHGFNDPYYAITHPGAKSPPAADHPPLTVFVLTPVSWLVDHPPLSWVIHEAVNDHMREHRYTMVVLGTFTVFLIGLLARRIGGDRIGLIAALIAAIAPTIWVNDGLVMSETVTNLTVVGAMLCAFAFWDRPSWRRAAVLGLLCGLAALARAELILFLPLLIVVLVLMLRVPWSQRTVLGITGVVVALAIISPWVIFNEVRFKDPTFLSTNDGLALIGSNCDQVYSGTSIGLTNLNECLQPVPPGDQSQVEKVYRQRAFDYMRAHKSRVPLVVLARIGRTWSMYRPNDMVSFNINEDREAWVTRFGLFWFYPLFAAAVIGAVILWRTRRRYALWVLVVPAIAITIGVAVTYGQTRFRAAAEPSLAILAAVALASRGASGNLENRGSQTPRETGHTAGTGSDEPEATVSETSTV